MLQKIVRGAGASPGPAGLIRVACDGSAAVRPSKVGLVRFGWSWLADDGSYAAGSGAASGPEAALIAEISAVADAAASIEGPIEVETDCGDLIAISRGLRPRYASARGSLGDPELGAASESLLGAISSRTWPVRITKVAGHRTPRLGGTLLHDAADLASRTARLRSPGQGAAVARLWLADLALRPRIDGAEAARLIPGWKLPAGLADLDEIADALGVPAGALASSVADLGMDGEVDVRGRIRWDGAEITSALAARRADRTAASDGR